MTNIPELLAPAGSYEALLAAIEAGADAVYLGGEFNARAFARNFDREKIAQAIRLCHAYGVRVYVTLNTIVFERELTDWLEYAEYIWKCGADAFILADLGAASLLKKYIPDVRLHASTQMTVHNSEGVRTLISLGFERVVVARELSRENIESIVRETGAEIEIFVHGALCVSSSGQCLFSSLVGGRSGNRGECAQPCRMLYNGKALLSLKDNCLASHISEILPLGVASLKIEGRMKSPEYVLGTVRAYRRLLDEGRDATRSDIDELEGLFCRSGFTDGYFIGKTDGMCGVRTEADKKRSVEVEPFTSLTRKIPISIECNIHAGEPISVIVRDSDITVTVEGAAPTAAESAPLDRESVKRCLSKLGGTPYTCESLEISVSDGLYARVSELNALRRDAVSAYEKEKQKHIAARALPVCNISDILKKCTSDVSPFGRSARFISAKQLCDSGIGYADFERIYLPIDEFFKTDLANGIICPPLVYDSEWDELLKNIKKAKDSGAKYALCTNISQIKVASELGYTVTADFRLNTANPYTAEVLSLLGADEVILSPEMKVGGMRDIHERKSVIAYGKIPVMTCEKCPIKEAGGCAVCKRGLPFYLTDRTGARFAVFGEPHSHRAVIYNSVPIYTADTPREMSKIGDFASHFIFSDESGDEIRDIVRAYELGATYKGKFKRI